MIYFVSDLHLGLYPPENSLKREKHFVKWLDTIRHDATELYLVGDIFDFWYEYRNVVPKGYVRFLGKLAELADAGIKIHFFTGNHDIWAFRYLSTEIGVVIHNQPQVREINGKRFFIAHGDGLGPGDVGFKFLRFIFRNPFLQWCYARVHPDTGMAIGLNWAKNRRYKRGLQEEFYGEDKERLIIYAKKVLEKQPVDYFVFGHRHIPVNMDLGAGTRLFYIGDWILHFSYLVFDDESLVRREFPMND